MVLSLVLFFCDRNLTCFTKLRTPVLSVIVSVQRVINWPADLAQILSNSLTSKRILLEENSRLHSELLLANAQLQRLGFLEQENSQLHVLLNTAKQLKTKFLAAQLLTLPPDTFNQPVTIDKGEADSVYVGQAVIDAYGLFGHVILVKPKTSKVLPVTYKKSAIPVTIIRNGIQAIAVGAGHDNGIELVNAPETMDVRVGDSLVTSGIGQRFPAGYVVGVVREIKHVLGARFMRVSVTPSAHINSSKNVLLIEVNPVAKLANNKK
ncbi:MAG: Rod shape-determining protein MreC [uncultured bacterium]|nr:MAG: Rod shape-determining protein MreC [uncultured bacterium]